MNNRVMNNSKYMKNILERLVTYDIAVKYSHNKNIVNI